MDCPYTEQLDKDKFFTYLRSVRKSINLFREANIPIQAELSVMQQQYGAIAGKMTVEVNGQEYTLQQAAKFLESEDRALREEVYRKIQERRLQARLRGCDLPGVEDSSGAANLHRYLAAGRRIEEQYGLAGREFGGTLRCADAAEVLYCAGSDQEYVAVRRTDPAEIDD